MTSPKFMLERIKNNLKVIVISILPPTIITLSILSWYFKPLSSEVFLGFCQHEQVVYMALARAFAERGFLIFYPSPYAVEEFPRVLTHLLFVITGALLKLGIPFLWQWYAIRLIFGFAMFYLGYMILKEFFEGKFLKYSFLTLCFGGGLAYVFAIIGSFFTNLSFNQAFVFVEYPYDWWFTNLFRVTYYPLEVFSHVLMFASILFFLRKNYKLSSLFYFLTWWSHPFTGATLLCIYALYFIAERDKNYKSFLIISLIFIFYYRIFLYMFPLSRNIAENWKFLYNARHLGLERYPSAWGIFIIAPIILGRRIKNLLCERSSQERKNRFIIYWIIAELILINNDLIPFFQGYQPMHFTRGNLFFPLVVLTFLLLRMERKKPLLLMLIFLLSLPDNLIFLHNFVEIGGEVSPALKSYQYDPLRITAEEYDILKKLEEVEETQVILSYNGIISLMIPAYTKHKTVLGQYNYVPYFGEKVKDAGEYLRTFDRSVLDKYNISMVILPRKFENNVASGGILYEGKNWIIYKI